MSSIAIEPCPIPPGALLAKYEVEGTYADCYTTTVAGNVTHRRLVEAFYTTPLFRLERAILRLVGKPSTDEDARELARGARDRFAAWTVEARADDQVLLCDYLGRTRSWLMVRPIGNGGAPSTRLYFGSAVVPRVDKATGQLVLGGGYTALLGFHKRYSVALLRAACRRLARTPQAP